MKTALILAALVLVTAPAFAGDRGNKHGHSEQSLSDEPSGNSDAAGAGRWTAQDAQGGDGEAPGNPDSTQGFGTHSATGQQDN
jgi:uncharacterized protein YdeI (BOF family)